MFTTSVDMRQPQVLKFRLKVANTDQVAPKFWRGGVDPVELLDCGSTSVGSQR